MVLIESDAVRFPFSPGVFVSLGIVYSLWKISLTAFVGQFLLSVMNDPNFKPRPTVSEGTPILWKGAPSLIFASKCEDNFTYQRDSRDINGRCSSDYSIPVADTRRSRQGMAGK